MCFYLNNLGISFAFILQTLLKRNKNSLSTSKGLKLIIQTGHSFPIWSSFLLNYLHADSCADIEKGFNPGKYHQNSRSKTSFENMILENSNFLARINHSIHGRFFQNISKYMQKRNKNKQITKSFY